MFFDQPESAMFICPNCNRLSVINDEFFEFKSDSPCASPGSFQSSSLTSRGKKKKLKRGVLIDVVLDTSRWANIEELNELEKDFEKYEFIKFPLCPTCAHRVQKHISSLTSMMTTDTLTMQDMLKQPKDYFINQLKSKMEKSKSEISIMRDIISKKNAPTPMLKHSDIYKVHSDPIPQFFTKPSPPSKHFILASCFFISHHDEVGIINNMRVSLYCYEYVPVWEINAAFVEICHLIVNMARILKRGKINFKCTSTVLFMKEDGTQIPLAIVAYDQKKMQIFNEALCMLFDSVRSLYIISDTMFDPFSTPPYSIDMSERKIGGYKFEVSTENLAAWNQPMMLLLLNLKYIQSQILMREDI